MSAAAPKPWTLSQFLKWEAEQPARHEFMHGRIVAMVGATLGHAREIRRLSGMLEKQLPRHCEVFTESTKLIANEQAFYPDIVVNCGAHKDDDATALDDATSIIEVTSPSTRVRDETTKVDAYLTLPTLSAYLILSPDHVRAFLRSAGDAPWHETDYAHLSDIDDLPFELSLA